MYHIYPESFSWQLSGRNKNTEPKLGIFAYPRGVTHDFGSGTKPRR
jgi:hypothetical protein